ncbi:hypothetical protein PPYR_02556 [Photinus pyralis]|uniref:Elongation of very long chain fatty acids protein n=1 Tax=Photinus pyralis TaxID=7054 RepID=A0A5N4B7N8_PHOPY|nr:elongation of very long chain fatty acids protein 1-like [Photinus pyralis]KAB0805586.1 hypothetical protein PPYR_02556 [Photinus pyralis]
MNCSVGSTHLEGMDYINEYYELIFIKWADERTATLPLMSSPFPIFGLLITYLYVVFIYLPNYMTHKKPYSLKGYLTVYNLFQVIACCVLIYGISTAGWTTHYTLGCQEADFSSDPLALRMAQYLWLTFIMKVVELTETCVFVLRKKANQVSFLHVYHHISTVLYTWFLVKLYPGGMASFPVLLNLYVHIIMYTYYFISSLGPEMQQKLKSVKSRVTQIQMIQLVVSAVYLTQILSPSCKVPIMLFCFGVPNLIINLTLFLDFYVKDNQKHD